MKKLAAIVTALGLGAVLVGGAIGEEESVAAAMPAVDTAALPESLQLALDDIEALRSETCPELPLIPLLAEINAESSGNPRAYSSAGAAGLLQMMPATWTSAGGGSGWDVASGPPEGHAVWDVREHLRIALPWMCGNLRTVTTHLTATGKTTSPMDALAVCHIAGCSRVTGSASGIPRPGEAGCGADCVQQIEEYLTSIHRWIDEFTAPAVVGSAASAQAFSGTSGGCSVPDPTGTGGCITPATAWMLQQFTTTFGKRSTSCWDAHAWNPKSDHPQGRGCDIFYGKAGKFPGPEDTALGWQAASWLQANADALHLSYLIWQGRIWSVARADEGWRAYTGGGVYDADSATGGHYDHIHVSVAP